MPGFDAFPDGALLVDDGGDLAALLGSETVVHFVVPMPNPVDVPDGWDISSSDPLTVDEITSLPPGAPQRRLRCYLQFFHEELPMSRADIDAAMAILQHRVIGAAQEDGEEERAAFDATEHWTFAHLMLQTPPDPDQDVLAQRLDAALEDLRQVQIALWAATGRHSPPVGVETIPVLITYLVRRVSADPSEWGDGIGLMLVPAPWKLSRANPPEPIDAGRRVYEALDIMTGSPEFFLHRRFELAARTQVSRGDYHAAVLSAATSAESLFDFLLSALLWEERREPDDVGALFTRTLDRRLTREFPPRIGGDWNPYGSGVIAGWSTRIRRVRNAAVHRGLEPTRSQADDAVATLEELSHAVGDLLRRPEVCERYPRTARLYSPEATGPRIEALLKDPREPEWTSTLSRWIREREVAVKASRGWPVDTPDSEVRLVGLTTPGGIRWAVWRPDDRIAVPVPRPEGLSAEQYANLDQGQAGPYSCFTMADPPRIEAPPVVLRPKGPWLLQHHLIPEEGVMVDPELDLEQLKNGQPARTRS